MNLEEILSQLMSANFRYEVLLNALLSILEEKKQADGTPIITKDELNKRAEEIKNAIIEKAKIARPQPGLIIPGGSVPPQPNAPKEG